MIKLIILLLQKNGIYIVIDYFLFFKSLYLKLLRYNIIIIIK